MQNLGLPISAENARGITTLAIYSASTDATAAHQLKDFWRTAPDFAAEAKIEKLPSSPLPLKSAAGLLPDSLSLCGLTYNCATEALPGNGTVQPDDDGKFEHFGCRGSSMEISKSTHMID